jgi:hypothetical protein
VQEQNDVNSNGKVVKFTSTDEIPDELPEFYELYNFDELDANIWNKSYPTPATDCVVTWPCCLILLGFVFLACITGFAFSYNMFAVSPSSDRMYLIFSD